MKKLNLEKCRKSNKGITLIALIITIIVLLILAGVTIAALTGTDAAPVKANEAKQKQDIGAAKDDVYLAASNAETEAYERVYVEGKQINSDAYVTAGNASTEVGSYVRNALNQKYGTDGTFKIGLATITVTDAGAITISTTDFTQPGSINPDGGILTWGELTVNDGIIPEGPTGNGVGPTIVGDTPVAGESVNYNPGTLTTASIDLPEGAKIERTKLASISLPDGASLDSEIDASQATEWVILDVTEDGDVLIIPTTYDTDSLQLLEMDGYNNAVEALDAVASIYVNSEYAKSARSITVDDVNKLENYTPSGENYSYYWENTYGMNDNLDIVENGGKTIDVETESDGETLNYTAKLYNSTPETAYYSYSLSNSSSYLGSTYCWLASRCVYLNSNGCDFGVRVLYGDSVCSYYFFGVYSGGNSYGTDYSYSVLPVVYLKSGITMQKDGDGVWQLTK